MCVSKFVHYFVHLCLSLSLFFHSLFLPVFSSRIGNKNIMCIMPEVGRAIVPGSLRMRRISQSRLVPMTSMYIHDRLCKVIPINMQRCKCQISVPCLQLRFDVNHDGYTLYFQLGRVIISRVSAGLSGGGEISLMKDGGTRILVTLTRVGKQ